MSISWDGTTLLINDIPVHEPDPEEWVKGLKYVPHSLVTMIGLGVGHELKSLLKRVGPQDKVIVVEPDPEVQALFVEHCPELQDGHRIYCVHNWDEFKQCFLFIGDWEYAILATLPSYQKIYPEFTKEFIQKFQREIHNLQTDQTTTRHFALKWQKNVLQNAVNLPLCGALSRGIGCYRGPAVVVAAGPSLVTTLPLLAKAKGKALILATQTTNRLFETVGPEMRPDLIFSFDGEFSNYYEHFEGVDLDIPLVFDPTLYYKILPEWKGPKAAMLVHPSNRWLEDKLETVLTGFKTGPSISNTLVDIAIRLGADPILIIGQDLAYTGGRFHAPHTHRSETWDSGIPPERQLIEVLGQDGNHVVTDKSMLTFLHWYEEMHRLEYYKYRIFNCTGTGANIRGFENRGFEECLDEFCREPADLSVLDKILDPIGDPGINAYLREAMSDLMECREAVVRGLQLIDACIHGTPEKASLEELAECDRKILDKKEALILMQYALRPGLTSLERPLSAVQEKVMVFRQTKQRYISLLEALEYTLPVLGDVIT